MDMLHRTYASFASNLSAQSSRSSSTSYQDFKLSSDDSDMNTPKRTYSSIEDSISEISLEEPPVKRPQLEQDKSYIFSSVSQNLNLSEDDSDSPKPTYSAENSTLEKPPAMQPRPEQGMYRFLIDAIHAKDLKLVQMYLNNTVDGDWDYGYQSPLHIAIEADDIPITQELLKHGFDINAENFACYTPLHLAVNWGRWEMVRFLLNNGANPNILDRYGQGVIHYAVKNCNNKAAKANNMGKDGNPLSEDEAKRWNEQNFAINFKIVTELVQSHSVDINLRCSLGKTALYYSVVGINPDYARRLVQLLLHYNADVDIMNVKGKTALSRAMTLCRADIVEDLMKKGANINILINDMSTKITPILWGISRNRTNIVELLLNYSTFNVNDTNLCPNHASLLHYATEVSSAWVIQQLINAGADVRITNTEGITPFLYCSWNNSSRATANRKLFLEHMVALESQKLYELKREELQFIHSDDNFELELHHRKLRNEMLALTAMKIPQTNVTFHEFLVSSDQFASRIIQYPSVQKYCEVKVLKKLFPAFSRLMSDRYTAGKVRTDLLDRTQAIAKLRGVFFSFAVESKTVPSLTKEGQYLISDCVDRILQFLNNRDLKHLLMAYENA